MNNCIHDSTLSSTTRDETFYFTGQLEPVTRMPCGVCTMSMIVQQSVPTLQTESYSPANTSDRPKGFSSLRTKWEILGSTIVPYKFRFRKLSRRPGSDAYKKRISREVNLRQMNTFTTTMLILMSIIIRRDIRL
jgi:hypothetical protein